MISEKKRKAIRAAIRKGEHPAAISERLKVSGFVVYGIAKTSELEMFLPYARGRQKRTCILAALRRNEDVGEIARRFSVGREYVCDVGYRASEGMSFRTHKGVPGQSFRIVAMLQAGQTQTKIGNELGISRQRVHTISQVAKEAGIKIPNSS